MLIVQETSAGLMGFRAQRDRNIQPQSATFEVALNGATLVQLRAVARLHQIGVGEAILRAIEDLIANQGLVFCDSPASVIAAYQEAVNKGAVYP